MSVRVFKFGGASVKDAPAIRNLRDILLNNTDEELVVVVSAMGKTTNFLEKLTAAYYRNSEEEVKILAAELRRQYEETARQLSPTGTNTLVTCLQPLFDRLHNELADEHSHNYDYDYDRIVSYGELLTTILISTYLNMAGLKNRWLDARRLVRTDASFREARVDWELSGQSIREVMQNDVSRLSITQGFIGGTAENLTTTLGREGSDYSAAIFAYALDAESVTVWKDVDGFFNADPKRFPNAVKLDSIPYEEAIELAYYGAGIIHPKTIKPLQNKKIPIFIKSFYRPDRIGSVITDCALCTDTPSYIVKDRQLLLTVFPRDFSFIATDNISEILTVLSQHRVKINLMQNSALSFSVCIDAVADRVKSCMEALSSRYILKFNDNVELLTVRHYTSDFLCKVMEHRQILLKQVSRTTFQIVTAAVGT